MMRGKLRHVSVIAYVIIILLNMQYITNAFNIKQSWAQVPPSAVATVESGKCKSAHECDIRRLC